MASRVVRTIGARCSLYKIKKVKNNCTCSNFEIRKKPNRCSLNIIHLEARILNALKTNAFEKLSSINLTDLNTALFVGTGGSYAGALFASKIINKKYNTITLAKQPREVIYQNNLNIEKVFLFSYSGTTNDLLVGTKNIENDKKIIIIKGELKKVIEKTKLKETQIISYYANFNKGKERGYLSFEGTIVPASLFFKLYYKNAKEFIEDSISYWKSYFDNYFKNFKNIFKSTKTINIFYGDNVSCAAFDLESKFIESGVFNVIMHEKKNFSHGRFINYEQLSDKVNIYLRSKHVSKYEKELLHYLKNDNNIIIESRYDNIFCEFDMLIMTQYFIYYLSKVLKIDMSKPSYSEEAMKIYFYKGEL